MTTNHPFHMVTLSPWPMLTSINIMNVLISINSFMHLKMIYLMIISLISMIMCLIQWWRDVIRESTFQGCHTYTVTKLIKMSMILFIISELMFFVAFFWTYFHSSIAPSIEIGMTWPPTSIKQINPYNIPLLNSVVLVSSGISITWTHYALLTKNFMETKISFILTIILGIYFTFLQIIEYFPYNIPLLNSVVLVSSGISITWTHYALLTKNFMETKISFILTIILGIYFTFLQIIEYFEASFCFNDSIYGSIFFMTTGFHGSHVNIGLVFLTTCFIRLTKNHFSNMHHLHFETASWYWHFVDIIWLFLYITIYWWNY